MALTFVVEADTFETICADSTPRDTQACSSTCFGGNRYWVQLCYALALLPEAEVLPGGRNGFSFDTISQNDIFDAINACQQAHNLTQSVHRNATTLFEKISADVRSTHLGEPVQKDWQRSVNALLMVRSSLAILHARDNDLTQAERFKHLVCDTDRQVISRTVSLATRSNSMPGVNIVVSAGGAGSTSLMWALQSAGVTINAGAGSSYLKHHRHDFAASVASELGVQVKRVLYVVRDPRAAVQSIFRRQFQYVLSVQLTGCSSSAQSSTVPRSGTLVGNSTLLPSSAAALQSLSAYIGYLAAAQQSHCENHWGEGQAESLDHRGCIDVFNSKAWMDPLPMWDHLKSWIMESSTFDESTTKPRQQSAGHVSSRVLVVLRERVLEPQVFDKLCSHLGIESKVQKSAIRRSLQEAQGPSKKKHDPQLTNAQDVVLTRHFAPFLEFVRTHMADEGFYEPVPDMIRQHSASPKKTKRKKAHRRSDEDRSQAKSTTVSLREKSKSKGLDMSSHDFEYM